MKKRILSFLLVAMMLVTMLPMTVFAMGTEMSDEFKAYLNEEGKLEVTFTSTAPDKESLINEYIWTTGSSSVLGDYYFHMEPDTYDEETNTCMLTRIASMYGEVLETFEVEIVFEEKISEKFASILTDGKIILPSTSKNISDSWVESYVFSFSDDEYNFSIATYAENLMAGIYVPLINEDFTEATIKMIKNSTGESELHVVQLERITEQSANFKEYLNADGKLEFNSIVPTDEEYFGTMFQVLHTEDMENGVRVDYFAEDFMSADLTVGYETHTVDIVYNYNEDVPKKLQPLINNFPEDIEYFMVKDMELVNYWVNTVNSNNINDLAGFSGELKKYISNYNVKLMVENGAGWDEPFLTERLGMAAITYEGCAYYVNPCLGAHAEHIIYVPDNTGDTKEELIAAAQKRIDEYLGAGNDVTVSYAGTAMEAWIDASYEMTKHYWEEDEPNLTKEEWVMGWLPAYEDFGADVLYIEGVKEDDPTFLITVTSGNVTKKYNVIIRKDSSKMITPTYATADMENDIEISSSSSAIPLDTAIQSDKLTSGTEYDKIMNVLDVEENMTFDISLYSDAKGDKVTKLENGTFEVKIPLTDELKDKDLVAYYVDENDEIVEYEVTVDEENGYAVFATDHFSIYTIAEVKEVEPAPNPTPDPEPENPGTGNEGEEGGTGSVVPTPDPTPDPEPESPGTGNEGEEGGTGSVVPTPDPTPDPEPENPDTGNEGNEGGTDSKPAPAPEVVIPENNAAGSVIEEEAETVVEKVPFTEEEKAEIEAGAEVVITLDVKDITETVSIEDKTKVEAEAKEQTVGMYLDVNMFKQVGDNAAVKIPELNGKIKIQLTVPEELLNKDAAKNRVYSVIRIHEDEVTVLDTTFDDATKYLSFETDHFSTYALVYKDVVKVPNTGDDATIFVWMMLLAVGGCAIAYGMKRRHS